MIEDPMSLHRTAFVHNNPVNYYDPDGFFLKEVSQALHNPMGAINDGLDYWANTQLNQLEKALTFDAKFNVPIVGEINISNEFTANYNHGTFQARNEFAGTLETKNSVYGLMTQHDIVLGKNAHLIGEGIVMTKDGQIFYTRSYLNANEEGLKILGVDRAQEYFTEMEMNMINNFAENLKGSKKETYVRLLEQDERWESLYGNMRGPGVWEGSNSRLAEMDQLLLNCGLSQACVNYVLHSQYNSWSPDFGTLGVGGLQIFKVGADFILVLVEGVGAGIVLVTPYREASPFLAAGSAMNLDSALVDLANGVGNIYYGFNGEEPKNLVTQGPIGDMVEAVVGDTEFLEKVASGGDILVFGAYTTPQYVNKTSEAYKIYQNASSSGVGSDSLKFLLAKTSAYLFELANIGSQIGTGGDILDNVEEGLVNN